MFNNLTAKIKHHRSLTQKLRRENQKIDEATEKMLHDQKIRYEVLDWLSKNGMLKDGVC